MICNYNTFVTYIATNESKLINVMFKIHALITQNTGACAFHMDLNIIKRATKVANKTTGAMFSFVFSEILIFLFLQCNVNGKLSKLSSNRHIGRLMKNL